MTFPLLWHLAQSCRTDRKFNQVGPFELAGSVFPGVRVRSCCAGSRSTSPCGRSCRRTSSRRRGSADICTSLSRCSPDTELPLAIGIERQGQRQNGNASLTGSPAAVAGLCTLGPRHLDESDLVLEGLTRFLFDFPGQRGRQAAGKGRGRMNDTVIPVSEDRGVNSQRHLSINHPSIVNSNYLSCE